METWALKLTKYFYEACHKYDREKLQFKDVRAKLFPTLIFSRDFYHLKLMTYLCQKWKKNGGSPTSFWRELARKNTLNLKNRALLANKTTMSVSLKIMQLDLLTGMFSAKYCSSGPIK